MKFSYYIFILYLVIFPFYFFERGNPQIADLFGVLLISLNIKHIFLNIKSNIVTKSLFLFVIYALFVNCIYMLMYRDLQFLKSSLYYLYSFFMLLLFFSKLKDPVFLKFILSGILISLSIQILLWPFVGNQGVRAMMFFKDPNQLAFWSFSMLIISYMVCSIVKPKKVIELTVLVLSSFFVLISASKSAIFGSLMFWAFYLIKSRKQLFGFLSIAIIGLSFLVVLDKIDLTNIELINTIFERVTEKKSEGKQGLDGRGYDRILKYPEHLLFGAGEGQYSRFNERIELHSTFFNILFSYGIIGFSIFMYAIFSVFRNSPTDVKLILFILILYTLAHMTLRAPLFWISILLLYHLKVLSKHSKSQLANE